MALDTGSTHVWVRAGSASSNLDPTHPEVPLEATLRTLKEMETGPTITTERLVLRRWSIDDRAELAALNADPEVMEHFPGVLTAEESFQMLQRIELHFEEFGFGLWAVNTIWVPRLIGFCGLAVPTFRTHFTPAVEIGWRFARERVGERICDRGGQGSTRLRLRTGGSRGDPQLDGSGQSAFSRSDGAPGYAAGTRASTSIIHASSRTADSGVTSCIG